MKKIIKTFTYLAVISFLLPSCWALMTTYTSNYKVNLVEVEYKKGTNKKINNLENNNYTFSDSILDIKWIPSNTEYSFELNNKSNSTLKIIWDDAIFVSSSGQSQKIMHSGVKYIDRNNSQPSTTILRNSKLTDIIIPSENIYYQTPGKYSTGGWKTKEMYQTVGFDSLKLQKEADLFIGKTNQILLPIKIDDVTTEYIFVFKFQEVLIKKNK